MKHLILLSIVVFLFSCKLGNFKDSVGEPYNRGDSTEWHSAGEFTTTDKFKDGIKGLIEEASATNTISVCDALCENISENPNDWKLNKYAFNNAKNGIELWIKDGVKGYYIKNSSRNSEIRFIDEERQKIHSVIVSWKIKTNYINEDEKAIIEKLK